MPADPTLYALVRENNRMLEELTDRLMPKPEAGYSPPTPFLDSMARPVTQTPEAAEWLRRGMATDVERLVRGQVADRLSAILFPMRNEATDLEHCLSVVGLLAKASREAQKTTRDIRDAALEEGMNAIALLQYQRKMTHEQWDAGVRSAWDAVCALKSKPVPEASAYPVRSAEDERQFRKDFIGEPVVHDFGWSLQQMRAGKKVRRWAWAPMAHIAMNERRDGFVNHAGGEWLAGPNDLLSDKWELAE